MIRSWQEDNIDNHFKVRDVSCKVLYLMDQNNKEPKLGGSISIITFFKIFFMRDKETNFIKKKKVLEPN